MTRVLKIFGALIGILILLIVLAVVLIPLLVDINDYKDEISSAVQEETGRELEIIGDLELSVFPWLRVELGETRLGNAPGFGPEPFVKIERAALGVKLLPLLRKDIALGEVLLEGLQVDLARDAQGQTNWDGLIGAQPTEVEEPVETEVAVDTTNAKLSIRNAGIRWRDETTGADYRLEDWDLTTGRLAVGEPFDLSSGLTLLSEDSRVRLDIDTEVLLDPGMERIELAEPRLEVSLESETRPEALEASLDATRIATDLAAQTLKVEALVVNALGLELAADLEGKRIVDEPALSGRFSIAEFSPRAVVERLGEPEPETRDPDVLTRASLSAVLETTPSQIAVTDLQLVVDDTRATGSIRIDDLEKQAMRFDLEIDQIDFDRYGAEDEPAVEQQGEQPETNIPVEALRDLNVDGTLRVGQAVLTGLQFTELELRVRGANGLLRIHPSRARFYDGGYTGDVRLDVRSDTLHLSLDEHVTGIDFQSLTRALAETDALSGRAEGHAVLTAQGGTTSQMIRTLGGNVDLQLENGAIEGIDLWYEIRRARALFEQQAAPERTHAARTPFTEFRGTAKLDSGVMRSDDLVIAMEYLRATGKGVVDLVQEQIDYDLSVTVMKIPDEGTSEADTALVGAVIPVKIKGTFDSPSVRPDIGAYAEQKIKEEVEEEKEKLEEKIEDEVKKKLKDLFGG